MMKVKTSINVIALRDLNKMRKGIRDRTTIKTVKAKAKVKEARLLQKKIAIINIVARSIFVRPSSL
jgi:hypothetical protein